MVKSKSYSSFRFAPWLALRDLLRVLLRALRLLVERGAQARGLLRVALAELLHELRVRRERDQLARLGSCRGITLTRLAPQTKCIEGRRKVSKNSLYTLNSVKKCLRRFK